MALILRSNRRGERGGGEDGSYDESAIHIDAPPGSESHVAGMGDVNIHEGIE